MLSEKEKKVLDLIDENEDEIVTLLRKLIKFKTITPDTESNIDREEHKNLISFVQSELEEMNFETKTWEVDPKNLEDFPGSGINSERDMSDMPIVTGELKTDQKGKSLILNGHYDVVPAGDSEKWSTDPFGAEIIDDKIYGRGACDMKGGIVAMLMAVRFIQLAGIELNGDLTVEVVPDEESTCMGTLSCCQKGYKADAAIVPEPSGKNKAIIAVRGNQCGKITVKGRAGHADEPQPHWRDGGAVNAISKSVKIIQALEELEDDWRNRPDTQHEFLPANTIVPTIIKGGDWVVKYPEEVQIKFDANFVPNSGNPREEIKKKITNTAKTDPWMSENPPEIDFETWFYGAEISTKEPIYETVEDVFEELDRSLTPVGIGTLTDAIHLINYLDIPTISVGPGSLDRAHKVDEFVSKEELINSTKAIALTILRWCRNSSQN
ncbi:hypothetical protein AKJ49_00155 [candidate division MSBL1 archaeon SCGC-AAA382A03]|uniref:Peptidase M20 dimerisation domain-containing protein n=1 Tax=candidate division MSBL1 archaeon SCGC-AAA382A03 TaxID=1698278 RepID=A0A133VH53_9EURY|nr:hypothetical protein AKJ49_00155 [candidate division MSBL1 archaeon SCGC-AAA382A03]